MGLTQDFGGSIEPDDDDWLRASPAIHRKYYEAGGPIVLGITSQGCAYVRVMAAPAEGASDRSKLQ